MHCGQSGITQWQEGLCLEKPAWSTEKKNKSFTSQDFFCLSFFNLPGLDLSANGNLHCYQGESTQSSCVRPLFVCVIVLYAISQCRDILDLHQTQTSWLSFPSTCNYQTENKHE